MEFARNARFLHEDKFLEQMTESEMQQMAARIRGFLERPSTLPSKRWLGALLDSLRCRIVPR
jgi:hypothetical protein